jgi:hypothetical protein
MRNGFRVGITAVVTGLCLLSFPGISQATATPAITPAFIAKVNAYCSAEEAGFNKVLGKFPYPNFNPDHPDVKTMRLVGKHFEKALSLRHAIPGQLKALGQPQVGQSQWDELKMLATQSDEIAIAQIRVALAGNVKDFVATVDQTGSIHNELVKAAESDGFAKSSPCGEIF